MDETCLPNGMFLEWIDVYVIKLKSLPSLHYFGSIIDWLIRAKENNFYDHWHLFTGESP